jgi:hypothetical protein
MSLGDEPLSIFAFAYSPRPTEVSRHEQISMSNPSSALDPARIGDGIDRGAPLPGAPMAIASPAAFKDFDQPDLSFAASPFKSSPNCTQAVPLQV